MRGFLIAFLGGGFAGGLVAWRLARHRLRADSWLKASTAVHDLVAICRLINLDEEPYSELMKPREALRDAVNFCSDDLRTKAEELIELGQRFASGELDVSQEALTDATAEVDRLVREQARRLMR